MIFATSAANGFLSEMEKISAKPYSEYDRARDNPFYKDAPNFKSLRGYQKARILAGIGANVAFGAVPLAAGAIYGAKKLMNKGPSYKDKYENAQREIDARDRALRMVSK